MEMKKPDMIAFFIIMLKHINSPIKNSKNGKSAPPMINKVSKGRIPL